MIMKPTKKVSLSNICYTLLRKKGSRIFVRRKPIQRTHVISFSEITCLHSSPFFPARGMGGAGDRGIAFCNFKKRSAIRFSSFYETDGGSSLSF